MVNFLKDNSIKIFQILLLVVIVANISDWFFKYSSETNHILNTAMFSLIGIAYLTFSWAFDKTILKITFGACGIFLIVMNFISDYTWVSIVGIVCLLVPMIIGKFLPDDMEEEVIVERG